MDELHKIVFKNDFSYNSQFVNKCILLIKFSPDEKRRQSYKSYLFKIMKDVVVKNIKNYIHLMSKTSSREQPEFDEMIAECYITFDKCLENYKVRPEYNFYFFYNKSLSRHFYKQYQTTLKRTPYELTDGMTYTHPDLQVEDSYDTLDLTYDQLGFSELDRRIIASRMLGQRTSEFLEENKDVTANQYSRSLKKIKERLKPSRDDS